MKYLNNIDSKIYFILENPELGFDPKKCMTRPFNIFPSSCKVEYPKYINRMSDYKKNLYNLSKKYDNVHILDPEKAFCDNKYCYAIKNGKMLYADDDHLSLDGSKVQANYLIKEMLNVQ